MVHVYEDQNVPMILNTHRSSSIVTPRQTREMIGNLLVYLYYGCIIRERNFYLLGSAFLHKLCFFDKMIYLVIKCLTG